MTRPTASNKELYTSLSHHRLESIKLQLSICTLLQDDDLHELPESLTDVCDAADQITACVLSLNEAMKRMGQGNG